MIISKLLQWNIVVKKKDKWWEMEGEREERRMAGNTSFNSKKKKTLNFMLL